MNNKSCGEEDYSDCKQKDLELTPFGDFISILFVLLLVLCLECIEKVAEYSREFASYSKRSS